MLMTQKEVAQKLRISLKTLQVWRKQGRIPFYRWGHRTIRFSSAEVEKFEEQRIGKSTNSHEYSPLSEVSEKGSEHGA